MTMRFKVVGFLEHGLALGRTWPRRGGFTVAYGEILSAERLPSPWGLRLHTRTTEPIALRVRSCRSTEDRGRTPDRCGVRIVDEWGAIITPTLDDFLAELRREPLRLRQSSDNA